MSDKKQADGESSRASDAGRTERPKLWRRRSLIVGGALVAAGFVAGRALRRRWGRTRAPVFIARHQRYDGGLTRTIEDGLIATGLRAEAFQGKRVLLKPNLVEPNRDVPHLTTHPAVIVAAAEVFRRWGAEVKVGEGPGHVRDIELALAESRVQEALDDARLEFVDLNHDETGWRENGGRASALQGFHLPRAILEADVVVSLPKLKTHHWVGATIAMKNLYGTLPGIKYGWPKNVLHHAGIPQTVYDINATLPKTIAIVDGIDCMEGDGPIMGSRKPMGLILIGPAVASVDATACRIMGIVPERIAYMRLAADNLGPLDDGWIDQCGERWQPLVSPFQILDRPHLRPLQASPGTFTS
jgi:uncharacterized protein (DUF362 family)